ncbi:MAG: hypothetical protein NVSMB30_19510 [Hymenobacter sp.]
MDRPSPRFFAVLGLGMLALCVGYAAAVLGSATWTEARSLDRIFLFYGWHIRPVTAAAYVATQHGLRLTSAGLGVGCILLLCLSPPARLEVLVLVREVGAAFRGLIQGVQALNPWQRRQALGVFGALTALRLYFSLANPEYDDPVSYEVFVSKGWLATSAYYPIPNNHVFSNTISLLFYQLNEGFWWSMRAPVLLISSGASVFLFAGLLRRAGYRVAAVSTTLFSFLQLSLYQAGVGRGYWLLILLASIAFFCTLVLAERRHQQRAAWAGLLVACVLGCYTVPTFVYVMVSAFAYLGWEFWRRRHWRALGELAAVGALIGLASLALYTPLLLVSGLQKLVGNGFVVALPAATFWRGLPAYIWHNEGFLAGQRTLGVFLTLTGLGLAAWLFVSARQRRLSADQTLRLRRLGWPALWFGAFPYAIIIAQRVFPPERVLLYKAMFFFMLLGLVVDWLFWRWPAPAHRWPRLALALGTILYVSYQIGSITRTNPVARETNAAYRAGLLWLATQPPGPVLAPEPAHNLFFRFYAHTQARQRPWQIDNQEQGNTRYDYVVAFPNKRGFFQPQFPFPPAYHNWEVDIYTVPRNYRFVSQPWRH